MASLNECVLSIQRKESMVKDIQGLWGSEITDWFKGPSQDRLPAFVVDNVGKEGTDPREWSQQVIGWIQSLARLVDLPMARQLLDDQLFERWTAHCDSFDWELSAADISAVSRVVQENPVIQDASSPETPRSGVVDGFDNDKRFVVSCYLDSQPLIAASGLEKAQASTRVTKEMTKEMIKAMCRYMAAYASEADSKAE